ncbi:SDR family NAD(P)-dependent oxidoreductase [Jannaschia rubra]|uniref:C signal n=1 Tax=Jannaschia rubra TaxID=282197 RepID=A0A0M6XQ50_9RHOB|nr:SDR family NAD(P)-dependent oxidoreductase [Jannaschia rubra]CTQ32154.1 C signal [Jannaschia rubra]SFG36384.1 Short-chain dehydrogenase [Jannaschia rubra]
MPTDRALVVGASGGIGAALANRLDDSHDVTRLSRSSDGLDVTDAASVARIIGPLEGPFDLVFVATGILAPDGAAPEKTLDAVDAEVMARTFAVNAIGPALVLRAIVPKLADAGRIGVLTARVGSIGDNRMGGWYSYRAAKAAANQIVHGAAIEIGRRNKGSIVVALHPGTVETPFTEGYKAPKVSAGEAAANLIDVLTGLDPAQSGGFFDYAGDRIEW